jgi:hypothetical protein
MLCFLRNCIFSVGVHPGSHMQENSLLLFFSVHQLRTGLGYFSILGKVYIG